ncbi:TetR/AcrR family transcriptional regulator [Streptomyces sp. AJS327]|uniref:TetR/AcrR family transcriptional regulator n=1 Tax=Streptomyces sp. AJS327 TaxID=2545265 RepID=UPI0015DDE77C|nr:helix-turn-helix domain-containing protein [Streptomyces sp. AJS327]MBA0054069.1 TetR/AcrR family transcriptional regulator [Streptomyces sp. AJS327]
MPTPKSTRDRILDAAERLLRTAGLARTTTKEIARETGCSEAALYKHFVSKEEIFVGVMRERLPRLNPLLDELVAAPKRATPHGPGQRGDLGESGEGAADDERSVERNLTEIARVAAHFYERSVPITASLFAEPQLKKRHFAGVRQLGAGPHTPIAALADYLRAERAAGRVAADADPDAAAALLLGACAQRAFLCDFAAGETLDQPIEEFAAGLARTVLRGISPG